MRITIVLPVALLLFCLLHIPTANAKCCAPDVGGDCGDNSIGTPCCGYNKCNAVCCACEGVGIIRQDVDKGNDTIPSVITAPAGVTWTCRDDHITKNPPKIREAAVGTAFVSDTQTAPTPIISAVPNARGRPTGWNSECDDILTRVGHGSGRVTLEQYRNFFNVTDEQSSRYKAVDAMFQARDTNNDGVLTQDELEVLL